MRTRDQIAAQLRRSIPALMMAAFAAFPIGSAWAASHTSPHSLKTAKTTSKKYTGPPEDMQWGTVQVTVTIKGKKITNVSATAPIERARSAFINQQALPLLKQEVLQAQSANLNEISGATMTSDAYMQSLQGALQKAHFKSPQR